MEKYKANKNSQNGEEVEERPKTQDEKNVENNVNTINDDFLATLVPMPKPDF